MAGKGYIVRHTFPVKHKTTGQIVDVTRENQDESEDMMSAAKIQEHVDSGALESFDKEDGSPLAVVTSPTPSAPAHTTRAGSKRAGRED
jgi:hypothetical protein